MAVGTDTPVRIPRFPVRGGRRPRRTARSRTLTEHTPPLGRLAVPTGRTEATPKVLPHPRRRPVGAPGRCLRWAAISGSRRAPRRRRRSTLAPLVITKGRTLMRTWTSWLIY